MERVDGNGDRGPTVRSVEVSYSGVNTNIGDITVTGPSYGSWRMGDVIPSVPGTTLTLSAEASAELARRLGIKSPDDAKGDDSDEPTIVG